MSQVSGSQRPLFRVKSRAEPPDATAENMSVSREVVKDKLTELDKSLRRRSMSTPNNMSVVQRLHSSQSERTDSTKKRSKFSLRRLFRKNSREVSQDHTTKISATEPPIDEALQRKTELEFVHTLMTRPAEMGMDFSVDSSEPDLVQTIFAPNCYSKQAIRFDKKLYQIDVANTRVATLSSLSGAAVLSSDQRALEFLQNTQNRIRRQQVTLFKEAEKLISTFIADPKRVLNETELKPAVKSPGSTDKVQFIIEEPDLDAQDLRWEMNSLHFSTDATSSESDEEGPTPEEIDYLAKQIRKAEGTRFKRKLRIHRHRNEEEIGGVPKPPPPNPLGHSKRALMRSHTTVPSGLCAHGTSTIGSSVSLVSAAHQSSNAPSGRNGKPKETPNSGLPFNLLSLTGQLSWLVSEYLERGSSTYQWASDLIHSISKMSVTRSTWLNVHQQLRETTELLYANRGCGPRPAVPASVSAKGEVAWTNIQAAFQAIQMGDANAATVTAETARQLLSSANAKTGRQLTNLVSLFEKKFHLAYVCDLVLWRAHKVLFATQDLSEGDASVPQLTDFCIRLLQVRLDQANVQNWSPELIDLILRWIDEEIDGKSTNTSPETDRYFLNELHLFKKSVQRFQNLVKNIIKSEFTSDEYLFGIRKEEPLPNVISSGDNLSMSRSSSSHSLHCHPHLHHHGQGGHQQDLRPLDADRCSHTYAALIKQIHDHAMSQRPLSYFAIRALYDIAVELGCDIDWNKRLETLQTELAKAYEDWEQLFKIRFRTEYYDQIIGGTPKRQTRIT
ncbi:hypothetical protein D915_000174 [Fasciola hepatica]|uniref:Uncharacterized protein n=1 Tax=Fasciola hepatica TaxID=6192 RepID=A0A4E0RKP4_FASHE|nr:hypothetical protein D915_000174 [Fasciola hepatica]